MVARTLNIALCTLAAILGSSPLAWGQDSVGRVLSVRGEVVVRPGGDLDNPARQVDRGDVLQEGDVIRTRKGGGARLLMKDKSILEMGPNTYLTLSRYRVTKRKRSVGMHLFVGRVWARVTSLFGGDRNYNVHTQNAVAGVRGTELVVDVDLAGNTEVTCVSGSVAVENLKREGTQLLGALQASTVGADGTVKRRTVTPADIKRMARATGQGGGLGGKGAEGRLRGAGQKTGRPVPPKDGGPGSQPNNRPPGNDPRDQLDPAGADAPAELDPATGKSRIRGTVEIRER